MFLPIIHILPILTQFSMTNEEEVIKIHFLFSKSSVELAPVTTAAGWQQDGSTYATPRFMARPSTVRTAIDLSIAKRRCSSTCGTLPFTNRIRKPI